MNGDAGPDIFRYMSARRFLEDWWSWRAGGSRGYTFGQFAKASGLSRAALANIIADRRRPREDTVEKLIGGMRLTDDEASFLRLLVRLDGAADYAERGERLRALFSHPQFSHAGVLDDEIGTYLADWSHVAIRELVGLQGFREEPRWISARLGYRVTVEQVRESLELLLRTGLVSRDEGGRLVQATPHRETSPEVVSAVSYSFHESLLHLASEALFDTPPTDRHFVAMTVPVPEDLLGLFKEELFRLTQELSRRAESTGTPSTRLVQLNIQLFALDRPVQSQLPEEAPEGAQSAESELVDFSSSTKSS